MKYDKDVIVQRIEKKIEDLEKGEEERFNHLKNAYKQSRSQRDQRRSKLFDLIDSLKGIRHEDRMDDDELVKTIIGRFEKVGRIAHGYSTLPGDEYIGQILQGATLDLREPVKDTSGSSELRSVLEVFKTGAPPEVGINDLRAFGLMQFLKYSGR